MSEIEEKISIAQAEKLIAHLREKWGTSSCPLCHKDNWEVQTPAFELREFHGGRLYISADVLIPVGCVTCKNCGNTVLINLLTVDIIKREGKENG